MDQDSSNAMWAMIALAGLAVVLWKGHQDSVGGGGGGKRGGGGGGGGGKGNKLGGGAGRGMGGGGFRLGQLGGDRSAEAMRSEMDAVRAARNARLKRFEASEQASFD
jgi:hypothetical protein